MNVEEQLSTHIKKAFETLYGQDVSIEELSVQPTRKEFEGTYTFVCFPFLKLSKKGPEQTGEDIGNYLLKNAGIVSAFNTVKGFLNIQISDDTWLTVFNELDLSSIRDHSLGEVMVEYASPNTNKPLHLGHLRNIFLGWSVAGILQEAGYTAHKVQIINDRGIHICKSMIAWLQYGQGATPETTHQKGDKLVGDYYVKYDKQYKQEVAELMEQGQSREQAEKMAPIQQAATEMLLKWESKDPATYELWKKMNGWVYKGFDETYHNMGVTFDKLYYESDTYLLGKEEVLKGLEKGVFFKKDDGSVWVDLTDDGLDEKILLRSDGTSVYMTQDIGTAILRYRDFPEITRQIYTVGNEQEYHFKVLFLILDKLGYEWARECYHLSYGMVDLPSGKMKSREGTVVDADDLMQEVIEKAKEKTLELGKIEGMAEEEANELFRQLGLGALKYYLLRVDPKKRILFNPEESVDLQGNTGPFIQYTHARISSLVRKARDMGIDSSGPHSVPSLVDSERELIHKLYTYPGKVREAARDYSPSLIAQYAYDLAKEYNKLWQNVIVLKEPDEKTRAFRVALSEKVVATIKSALLLLGIEAPERM